MRTQNTQQYHAFIQKFFSLFGEIKKEDDPIYNTRIGFNAVRFLIENPNWNLDENKNKACKVIFQKCNKIKEPNQELQEEAKGILNEYVDEDGVKEVSIYDNHANIALKDNKKEFKISEFLNSDFCQENGISGFSTLHSDGKSGMHGFIVEEGKEKRKVRHYAVTDGSYEMTLNWHDKNGKKCTIKIKIDKEGVDLVERNGVTEEQLKANKDVKIGGLFLHQIQFREKGREQENKQSSETFIGSNSKNVGVQAPQFNSSYDSGIEEDFNNTQEAKDIYKLRWVAQKENLDAKVHNFQLPLAENLQNKKIRLPVPPRISSLKKDISDEQDPGNKKPDRNEQENSISSNQQQEKGEDLFQDIRNFKRSNSWNADVEREEDKRPTFTTFGYTTSGRKKTLAEEASQVKSAAFAPLTQEIELKKVKESKDAKGLDNTEEPLNDVASILAWRAKFELSRSESEYDEELSDLEDGWGGNEDEYPTLSNPQSEDEQEKSHLSTKGNEERGNEERGNDEQKEIGQENGSLEDSLTDIKTNDSGYSSPTYTSHYNFQINSEQLKKSLENIEPKKEDILEKLDKGLKEPAQQPKDLFSGNVLEKMKIDIGNTLLTEFTGKLNKETQKFPLKPVNQKEMSEQTKERLLEAGLLKDSSIDVKIAAEQENVDTNLTIEKNSELYKLLEKDAVQLKARVIEEEKETEYTCSPDRNRIALANRNRIWAKRIAEEKQKKNDGIKLY